MASKTTTTAIGAGLGMPFGPAGTVIGGAIGSLFGKKKEKGPWAWYKQHPEEIPGALAKDRDPKKYSKYGHMFKLLEDYEQATEAANVANERRYQQLLQESSELEKLYRRQKYVPQDFDDYDYGESAKAEVEEQRRYGQAESLATLQRQGLGGSTVVGSIIRQFRDTAGRSRAAIEADVRKYQAQQRNVGRQERMGFETQKLSNIAAVRAGKMGVMERKTDVGPDPQFFSQMFEFSASKPGVFREPTQRKRAKLEQIYQDYSNRTGGSNS